MKHALLLAAGLALIPAATPAAAHERHRGSDEAMIAARIKIFGAENVDARTGAVQRDKVVMSGLTHTTMAISIDGEVVLADTFIARLETKPGRTPFVIQD